MVACMVARERLDAVPDGVLAAFGAAGVVPVRLPGGQGSAWRAGQLVLKPVDSVREGRWFAEVCDGLAGPGFRVPWPVPAVTGDWVALDQLAGEPELGQLLARALIYRQITEIIRRAGTAGIDTAARTGRPVTDLIHGRARAAPSSCPEPSRLPPCVKTGTPSRTAVGPARTGRAAGHSSFL